MVLYRYSPERDGFIHESLLLIAPLFILFGFYLLNSCWSDYGKIAQSSGWKLASGNLTALQAAAYRGNLAELPGCFFNRATLQYSYSANGQDYSGETVLAPQGPRQTETGFATGYKRTLRQAVAPFKFTSLAPDHQLVVRYDPLHPSASVLAEVLQEHLQRMSFWGFGSLILGIAVLFVRWLLRSINDGAKNPSSSVDELYAQLNPNGAPEHQS